MWIFSRQLEDLADADLRFLVENKVGESATLEFKRDMWGRSDADKRELLRDVASMANAEGGAIIVGMDQTAEGAARELVAVPDATAQADRITDSCVAGIAERILGLQARAVPFAGGEVIVVRIPRSYRRPHMVTFEGRTDFWVRQDRQKGRMSIAEVKAAVISAEDLEMRLERFLEHRRTRVGAETGTALKLGITATPLSLESGRIDVNGLALKRLLQTIDTTAKRARSCLLTRGYAGTPTLEGRRVDIGDWSLHVFRTGHVEFIVSTGRMLLWPPVGLSKSSDAPPATIYDAVIMTFLCRIYDFVRELRDVASIADPFAFTLNVWNCRGLSLSRGGTPWPEDHLFLPPVMVGPDEITDVGMRRIADLFWNAFGVERAPFFDAEGKLEPFQ